MKKFLTNWTLPVIATIIFTVTASTFAAQGSALMEKPELVSVNIIPLFNKDQKLTSLRVTTTHKVLMLLSDGKTQQEHLRTNEYDLVQQGGMSVILNKETGKEEVELADFGDDVIEIANYMWFLNNPRMLPTNPPEPIIRRRETLRKAHKDEGTVQRRALREQEK